MKSELLHINDKINSIQSGLLRCNGTRRTSFQVKVVSGDDGTLNCVFTNDHASQKLVNRKVSLIQRHNDDYLYVAGRIISVDEDRSKVVAVNISKAYWFIKKAKGRVSWLENKCVYESIQRKIA